MCSNDISGVFENSGKFFYIQVVRTNKNKGFIHVSVLCYGKLKKHNIYFGVSFMKIK